MNILFDLEVCSDCLMAIANCDYSGMDEQTEQAVRLGTARLEQNGNYLVIGDKEFGFSSRRCDCCRQFPGDRFEAHLLSK